MNGLSLLGVEFLDLAKGLGGFLSGAGGLMKSATPEAKAAAQAVLLEQQRAEELQRLKEADTKKKNLLGVGCAVAAALGLALWVRKRR